MARRRAEASGGRPRTRGRPRSGFADRAILEATLAVLAEQGYGALSIEAVADRTGVTRPTVYRRHASKAELVVAAVTQAFESANPAVPDTGSAREDLRRILANLIRMLAGTPMGPILRGLVPELPRDPALRRLADRFDRERRRLLRAALVRGVERGELRPDLAVELTIDSLLGAIYLRLLLTGAPLGARLARDLVRSLPAPDGSPSDRAPGLQRASFPTD